MAPLPFSYPRPQSLTLLAAALLRRVILALLVLSSLSGKGLAAQTFATIAIDLPNGSGSTLPVERHRGYAAFSARALSQMGWSLQGGRDRSEATLRHSMGVEVRILPNFPHLAWNGGLQQLAHPPYLLGEDLFLPLQVLVELFPRFLPNVYAFDSGRNLLTVRSVGGIPADRVGSTSPNPLPGAVAGGSQPARAPRILVIDPGHGGSDPGAIGPGGTREADLALALALALAREFEGDSEIEVRLTRDRDVEVPLWSRGEMATEWKGDRPGVFLSIHMNALGDRSSTRGFETYFLSEARDEHERRVAALENASLPPSQSPLAQGADPLLTALLRDLQAFDHQHWSADLAEVVQRELGTFHPGPDRGVKQGPFAVITNSLMPSVLVEVGFITSPEEERLLGRTDFQRNAAQALARAVRSFFQRYPPGGNP